MESKRKDEKFGQLQQTLEEFIENSRHICVMASDFPEGKQQVLNQKMHTLVSGLQRLDQLKGQFVDVNIPHDLLSYVDESKNPQLYTRRVLENTTEKNCELNGKLELYKKFRATLLLELSREFSNETIHYRARREGLANQQES